MCLTIPAKIIEINGSSALVNDGRNQQKTVDLSAVKEVQLNDWILITGETAVTKITPSEAEEILKYYQPKQGGNHG